MPRTRRREATGRPEARRLTRRFGVGLARAFGGAVFFSMPLLMTMEMWWLGFYMNRFRLVLFMVLMIPLLIGLSHYSGFEETANWWSDAVDAAVAYGVGFAAAAIVLVLFNVIDTSMPAYEVVGKVALQAVPASIGAVLANSQFVGQGAGGKATREEQRKERAGYGAEVFFMAAGALFFAFNVAPTEEMILIAFRMTPWHEIALALVSIAMLHAFVYAVDFRGQHRVPEGTPWWSYFLRFSVVGYAVALLISAYVLWTFGRYEGPGLTAYASQAIVLGFPASLGAAAARLIL